MTVSTPHDVLSFWFGPIDAPDYPQPQPQIWWGKGEALDDEIRTRFGATLEAAARGELADWNSTPRGRLAHVIVMDQFSRNIHRDKAEMYALDHEVQDVALRALLENTPLALTPVERTFLYMPFMHAENVALQRLCVRLCAQELEGAPPAGVEAAQKYLDYARQHAVIVERFSRFPHRNTILGRVSTEEELAFLKEPNSSF